MGRVIMQFSPLYKLENSFFGNILYIKRDDLIPFSFGGNKARKAALFFFLFDKGNYDCLVTYGSSSSNHCRVVANECCQRGMPCYIIGPEEASQTTYNSQMMGMFGAEIVRVPVTAVHETIEAKLAALRVDGKHPYFIEGGGHGDIGTEAYVQCYREIAEYEKQHQLHFDYIFFASGTGTTQAGLVCGQLIAGDVRGIIGISIARPNPRGREVVLDSIRSYLKGMASEEEVQKKTHFVDDYAVGYGTANEQVLETIKNVMCKYGIPLDKTYTGKAFWGMQDYVNKKDIKGKNILFLHTGGTPLFFDTLRMLWEDE